MKKFVVFKKENVGFNRAKVRSYTTENVGGYLVINGNDTGVPFMDYKLDNSNHFSFLEIPPKAYHFQLADGYHEDTVVPTEIPASSVSGYAGSGYVVSGGFSQDGFVFILMEDETKVLEKIVTDKKDLVTVAYNLMNTNVYAEMAIVFGTTNPESATAYHDTWRLMANTPTDWYASGITARFARGGVVVNEALDTVQKVQNYADACLVAVKNYGVWRMQRIEQFRIEKNAILNS